MTDRHAGHPTPCATTEGGSCGIVPVTLADFLLTRIAEDEDTARRGFSHPDRWVRVAPMGIPNGLSCTAVLAECEAKRQIVGLHDDEHECQESDGATYWTAVSGTERRRDNDGPWVHIEGCQTLRLLALPYSSHPDYREEWRP